MDLFPDSFSPRDSLDSDQEVHGESLAEVEPELTLSGCYKVAAHVGSWYAGGFFLLVGLLVIGKYPAAGAVCLLISAFILPPLVDLPRQLTGVSLPWYVRDLAVFLLFLLLVAILGGR